MIPNTIYPTLSKRVPTTIGFNQHSLRFVLAEAEDRVRIPDDPGGTLDLVDTLTIMAWVKRISPITAGAQLVLLKGNAGAMPYAVQLRAVEGARFLIQDTVPAYRTLDSVFTSAQIVDRWVCIAVTFDKPVARWYLNGALDNEDAAFNFNMAADNLDLCLGRNGESNSGYLDGYIALVLLYNRALSTGEIYYNTLNYHSPLSNGLVLWMPLEEGHGLIAYDHSGNGNNGTLLPAGDPPLWKSVEKWELREEVGL